MRKRTHKIEENNANIVMFSMALIAVCVLGQFMTRLAVANQVTNFEECIKAPGSYVMETNPAKCVTQHQQLFEEPTQ